MTHQEIDFAKLSLEELNAWLAEHTRYEMYMKPVEGWPDDPWPHLRLTAEESEHQPEVACFCHNVETCTHFVEVLNEYWGGEETGITLQDLEVFAACLKWVEPRI